MTKALNLAHLVFLISFSVFILVAEKTSADTVYPAAGWDHKPDGKNWSEFAHQAITGYGADLLSKTPSDIRKYCPAYNRKSNKEHRAFWVYLISALAKFESNYDPRVKFDETRVDPKMLTRDGKPIISRGLLQISKESANGYRCGIGDPEDLHDPQTNISCAVRIFNRWVGRDGVISARIGKRWRGVARYFSPFRSSKKRDEMARQASSQPFCQ